MNTSFLSRIVVVWWTELAVFAVIGALTFFLPSQVLAWGAEGHQVIAEIAQAQLQPSTRQEVERLLALEPGQTLASISTWADEHRNPATARWHFVNFPRDSCSFSASRDCSGGQCVVGAIDRQIDLLVNNKSDEGRLFAMKYLVHLVGDLYQPLHAGYEDDRGGNSYQLQAFNRGTNLHALWDSGLLRHLDEDAGQLTKRLSARQIKQPATSITQVQAAEASCQIVGMPGFYPPRQVGADYAERFTPVVEHRLMDAGTHLAQILNRVFSGGVR
ncbi:MAG: S1/P1 nuclease [Pseudomonadota bacterium]